MNIGKQIRHFRKTKKLTLAHIAENTGLSIPFLSEVERGIKSPSIETLLIICNALAITPSEFFSDEQPDMPPDIRRLLETAKDLSPEQRAALQLFLETMLS